MQPPTFLPPWLLITVCLSLFPADRLQSTLSPRTSPYFGFIKQKYQKTPFGRTHILPIHKLPTSIHNTQSLIKMSAPDTNLPNFFRIVQESLIPIIKDLNDWVGKSLSLDTSADEIVRVLAEDPELTAAQKQLFNRFADTYASLRTRYPIDEPSVDEVMAFMAEYSVVAEIWNVTILKVATRILESEDANSTTNGNNPGVETGGQGDVVATEADTLGKVGQAQETSIGNYQARSQLTTYEPTFPPELIAAGDNMNPVDRAEDK